MATTTQKFHYGQNIFFGEKEVALPRAKLALPVVSGPAEVTALPEGDGIFIHVGKTQADASIRIALAGSTRLVIAVDDGAKATIVEEGRGGRSSLDLSVGAGADVRYCALRSGGVEYAERRAAVARDGRLTWVTAHLGAIFGHARQWTRLTGAGAGVKERALFIGRDSDRFDLYSEARHEADATTSDLLTRGALGGSSKAIVRGLVHVAARTKACVARQKEDTLLLSREAEVDAVPMLEIATEDVRCGHSASTGRIDDERLFYLMSRGLRPDQAATAVIEGFFAPVLAECDDAIAAAVRRFLLRI